MLSKRSLSRVLFILLLIVVLAVAFSMLVNYQNKDTDNDGLTDMRENELGTNPSSLDTDNDGNSDSYEIQYGLNPNIKESDLEQWVVLHPRISENIVWQNIHWRDGVSSYSEWSETQKAELLNAYQAISSGQPQSWIDPLTNIAVIADGDSPTTVLSESNAWQLYITYIANTLFMEINHKLNWSIAEYSNSTLADLLDSRSFFQLTQCNSANGSALGYNLDYSVPAPLTITKTFLESNQIIKQNRLDTISALLEWCELNLDHFTGESTAGNFASIWQYRGVPPVSRVISGTNDPDVISTQLNHWTAGCWGTTGFFKSVLRAVNIPVESARPGGGHTTAFFVSDGLYLSHGDDPYFDFDLYSGKHYSASEFLISSETYNSWFGSGVSPNVAANNVGRQLYELKIQYLPNSLLQDYCLDQTAGLSHGSGKVYACFSQWYSVSELEKLNLWGRLDEKVSTLGGKDSVMNLPTVRISC